MISYKFTTFFLLYVASCLVHFSTQDSLENFVRVKMANYSTWLQANNLDPSPLVPGPTFFHASNNVTDISVQLSNYGVSGYSEQLELEDVFSTIAIKVFLLNLKINKSVTFYGDYTAVGNMYDGNYISGNGTWRVQVKTVLLRYFGMAFEELPSGFLNITIPSLGAVDLDERSPGVYFENLLENESAVGHEDGIRSALFDGFQQCLQDDMDLIENPIRTMFLKFWDEILSETTMDDIRNTPPPSDSTALF